MQREADKDGPACGALAPSETEARLAEELREQRTVQANRRRAMP